MSVERSKMGPLEASAGAKARAAKSEGPCVKSRLRVGGIATSPGTAADASIYPQQHNEKLVLVTRKPKSLPVRSNLKAGELTHQQTGKVVMGKIAFDTDNGAADAP
jgi:hypothetical protein